MGNGPGIPGCLATLVANLNGCSEAELCISTRGWRRCHPGRVAVLSQQLVFVSWSRAVCFPVLFPLAMSCSCARNEYRDDMPQHQVFVCGVFVICPALNATN